MLEIKKSIKKLRGDKQMFFDELTRNLDKMSNWVSEIIEKQNDENEKIDTREQNVITLEKESKIRKEDLDIRETDIKAREVSMVNERERLADGWKKIEATKKLHEVNEQGFDTRDKDLEKLETEHSKKANGLNVREVELNTRQEKIEEKEIKLKIKNK